MLNDINNYSKHLQQIIKHIIPNDRKRRPPTPPEKKDGLKNGRK
jgi:hypothetical protein